jgi:ParB family chromosome partitioning protein
MMETLRSIPLGRLYPSPNNPRKSVDETAIAQLTQSIGTHGINVPLIVRPIAVAGDEFYEIVSGHRRHKAALLAGVAAAPCIVRELTDEQAAELALVDNLQREDVPPMEEADAYAAMAERMSVQAIADRAGRPIEYVTRRLKLRALTEPVRDAMALQLITLDHALLLAKLGAEEQEKALRYAVDRTAVPKEKTADLLVRASQRKRGDGVRGDYSYWEPQSPLELKSFIERELKLQLSRAPWDLADPTLVPSAGPCAGCPKNTADNTALFGDLAVKEATCTDAVCFNAKREAVRKSGAVRVSWKPTDVKPKWAKDDSGPDLSRVLKYGQWIDAGKTKCDHITTGVTVDYHAYDEKKRPGAVLKVCVAAGCKIHPKEWEKVAPPGSRNDPRNISRENAERRAKRDGYVASETPIREAVFDAIVKSGKITHDDIFLTAVSEMLAGFNADLDDFIKRKGIKSRNPRNPWEAERAIVQRLETLPVKERDGFVFELLSAPYLQPNDYLFDEIACDRESLWALAKKVGVNADAIAKTLSAPASGKAPAAGKKAAKKRKAATS